MRPLRRSTRSGRGPSRLVGAPGGGFPSSIPSLRRIPGIGRHRDQTQSGRTKLRFPTPVSPITTTLALAFGASTAPHPGTLVKAADLVHACNYCLLFTGPSGKYYDFRMSLHGSRKGAV